MSFWKYSIILLNFALDNFIISSAQDPVICMKQQQSPFFAIKTRRYDITDMGWGNLFHGWVDVQGQKAANDYCRFVGDDGKQYLACALAGTHGSSDKNYLSVQSDFNIGYPDTWYMKDEDGDGRDDYCRCVGPEDTSSYVVCTKSGPLGFYGSKEQGGATNTFVISGLNGCHTRNVRPEFGRESVYSTKCTFNCID